MSDEPSKELPSTKEVSKTGLALDAKGEVGEDVLLVDKGKHRVSFEEAKRLRRYALVLAWLTVVLLAGLSITILVLSTEFDNSSALAVALETLLDTATSCVVIWRYSGTASMASLYSRSKERAACICLGVLCFIIAIVILVKASISLSRGYHVHNHTDLLYITVAIGIICLALTFGKGYVAYQLESISIGTDTINSALGVVLAASTITSYYISESTWYIDGTIGVCAAFVLSIYGTWVIVYEVRIVE